MTDLMYEQLPGHVENSLLDLKPACCSNIADWIHTFSRSKWYWLGSQGFSI